MNTINQLAAGCFLFSAAAFRTKTIKSFEKKVLNGKYIKIEGIHAFPDTSYTYNYAGKIKYATRYGGKSIYDQRNISLLLDGAIIRGRYLDSFNNRMLYYTNENKTMSLMILSLVELYDSIDLLETLQVKNCHSGNKDIYSMAINISLPDMDMIATKLASY